MTSTVRNLDVHGEPLRTTLKLLLDQLDLTYVVSDGLLRITSKESAYREPEDKQNERVQDTGGMNGMAGMGGAMGLSLEQSQAASAAGLDRAAASAQANELKVVNGQSAEPETADKAGPSVTFPITGRLD